MKTTLFNRKYVTLIYSIPFIDVVMTNAFNSNAT